MVENGREWRHFSSPKEAPYVGSAALPFHPLSLLLISMLFCILGRHCSVAREYAACLKARKAIVVVERRAKKSPFSFSRRILALYSRSALNRIGGWDSTEQVFPRTEIRESWNWKIREIGTDLFIYFFFIEKALESECSYAAEEWMCYRWGKLRGEIFIFY